MWSCTNRPTDQLSAGHGSATFSIVPSLRPARTTDVVTIASIWHDGWRDGHLGSVPEHALAARTLETFQARAETAVAVTTVAEVEETIAGFTMVVGDELEQIYVASSHRGSGIAELLLSDAERQLREKGHAAGWLAVVAGNERARAFYHKRGWRDDGPIAYLAAGLDGPIEIPSHRYVKDFA